MLALMLSSECTLLGYAGTSQYVGWKENADWQLAYAHILCLAAAPLGPSVF